MTLGKLSEREERMSLTNTWGKVLKAEKTASGKTEGSEQ